MYAQLRSSDIAKMISRAWKELPDHERVTWQHKAKLDRERYEQEKAAYKGPWKIPNVKDPNAPKKPMSAFLAFGNERRRAIAAANPNMNGTEISCLLSKLWRECPEEIRKTYRDREVMERRVFKKRREEWLRKKKDAESSESDGDDNLDQESSMGNCSQEGISVEPPLSGAGGVSEFDTTSWLALEEDCMLDHSYNIVSSSSTPIQPYPPALEPCNVNTASCQTTMIPPTSWIAGGRSTAAFLLPQYPVPCSASASNAKKSPTRFDNYSMEDILEDEELFEDFSPADVPNFASCLPSLM